jgi:hypothetical protein
MRPSRFLSLGDVRGDVMVIPSPTHDGLWLESTDSGDDILRSDWLTSSANDAVKSTTPHYSALGRPLIVK